MRIGVPKETAPGEQRVALTPDSVARLKKAGSEIIVERDAGASAFFPDKLYSDAGATIAASAAEVLGGADVITKVQRPSADEAAAIREGAVLISLVPAGTDPAILAALTARHIPVLGLERVPRITRAQSMDVLSSQSTVAGYKAVLIGAAELGRFLPMLTTAAGNIAPARAFVLGAGVAGLQAIATARRLGAVVSAFDVRAAVREQVQSLGATFVAAELAAASAEDKGGYARAQSDDEAKRTLDVIAKHIKDVDLVVTTAQIPGRKAPVLITTEMLATMRPGSVIVDLAAETGGNCTETRAGETRIVHGVKVIGPVNLPATIPYHASQMFSKNLLTLLQHMVKDGVAVVDPNDEIVGPMLVNKDAVAKVGV
jgi:proton-translocating NAD(P)+ transhydrogenase subunit alpha